MNKILLIIQREYSSRVKKKSFLLTTLLVPILFPTIIGLIVYFSQSERKEAAAETIYVLDESSKFDFTSDNGRTEYIQIGGPLESARQALLESDAYALLYIPDFDLENPEGFEFLTQSSAKDPVVSAVERKVEGMIRDERMASYQVDRETLDKLNVNISLSALDISEGEGTRSDARINIAIGYLTGFLIYMFMFAYGGQVMQGVIEEKSNKIVEIIISTVKPFQLMLGKILGIALVGLTQVGIWIVLMWAVWIGVMAVIGPDVMPNAEAVELFNG
jgi:ABC-2 type transport system permease protein